MRGTHGKVRFRVQRYRQRATGLERSYFDLTDQFREGYLSLRLEEFAAYYAGRISYEEVERLLVRTTGAKLLSDQKIQQLVVERAATVSRMHQAKIARLLEAREMPAVRRKVDLYAAEAGEVALMEDGIQVKQQKAQRERRRGDDDGASGWQFPSGEAPPNSKHKAKKKRVMTDVAMLEKREVGSFEYLCGGIDERGEVLYDVVEAVRGAVVEHYGDAAESALAVVAVTDGAKNIRSHLERAFDGAPIPVILDWYHLCKRVKELISMIARCKTERKQHLERLFADLWRGQTEQAIRYLSGTEVTARNPEKLSELITYLEKHNHEIIDYERRQQAGKTIGSGRMEKGVDQAIGCRQKKKGMSWSEKGSKALGILRVVELNGQWEEVWFGRTAA